MKRCILLLVMATLVLTVVAGCGPTAAEPTQVAAEPTKAAAEPTKVAEEPTKVAEEPTQAPEEPSKIVVVQNAEVRFMDPTLRPTTGRPR